MTKPISEERIPSTLFWGLWVGKYMEISPFGTLFITESFPQKLYKTTLPFSKWIKLSEKQKKEWCMVVKRILKVKKL